MPRRKVPKDLDKKLTKKEYVQAIIAVAKLSIQTSPVAVSFKLFGALVDAILPIAITFFAASTTTALAAAYNGDSAAGQKAITYVIIAAALGLVATAWRSIDQYVQQLMRYRVEAAVSDRMYNHFLSLEFWRYDDKETADLYDRAQQFTQFFAYVFDRIASILSQLISLALSLIALFIFLPWLALIVLVAVIPGLYIQIRLSRAQAEHWNNNVDVRRSRSYIEWNLLQPKSIAELRLNGLVRHLLDLRQSLRDKDERERLNYERRFIGRRLLADAFESAIEVGSLIYIVLEIIARTHPIGQFVYVQQLVSRAITSANGFVNQLSTIDQDLFNLFDYQRFMKLPSRVSGARELNGMPDTIAFQHVSFRYPGALTDSLKDISLTIKRGSHVAIVGENGAGKSTFIKLLTGLYTPSHGVVALDTVPLSAITITSWHKQLAVLMQDFAHYNFADVRDNVYFGDVSQPVNKVRVVDSLEKAEALTFAKKLPQKLKTVLGPWMEDAYGNKGTELSGGQWQRLALARGFYRDAATIILDEPTSAIDALAEARIFKRLFAKSNNKTVVTISHRLSTVEKADVIYVFKNGEIVENGTHQDLVRAKGEYYTMFESQITRTA